MEKASVFMKNGFWGMGDDEDDRERNLFVK